MSGPSNKGKRYPADPITPAEAERILDTYGESATDRRNAAVFVVLYRCGLRCAEACSLDVSDLRVDGDTATLRVRWPKGIRRGTPPRSVGVDRRALAVIDEWLAARSKVMGNDKVVGPMFVTHRGTRLDTSHVRRQLPKAARDAGIVRRVHPHGLRHACAVGMYDAGYGVLEIMHALGHTNLNTTQRYLVGIGSSKVVGLMKERDW